MWLSAMARWRWRLSLLLGLLLLLPVRIGGKSDDDDDDEPADEDNEDNDSDDDDEADEPAAAGGAGGAAGAAEKSDAAPRRRPPPPLLPTPQTVAITRTTAKRPLECYVCAFKIDSQIKACLDPTKHRVHTMTCHSMEDKCFTTVMTKNNAMEGLVRGCRSGCAASSDTTCCEVHRCNNQPFAMPVISHQALATNKGTKSIPTTVLFFVTILLVLQTVVKVSFI